eukprot:scaffold66140_cov18-Tisochrysis_lutea.AAC.1
MGTRCKSQPTAAAAAAAAAADADATAALCAQGKAGPACHGLSPGGLLSMAASEKAAQALQGQVRGDSGARGAWVSWHECDTFMSTCKAWATINGNVIVGKHYEKKCKEDLELEL